MKKWTMVFICVGIMGFWVGVFYVAVHFVSKFW